VNPPLGPLLLIVILAVGVVRLIRQTVRASAVRRPALDTPASFRARVSVKHRYGAIPGWAQRVKGPMELLIRGPYLEIAMARPFPGALLGVNRYLFGPETVLTTDPGRAPSKGQGWIVLAGKQDGKPVEVAIMPHVPRDQVLNALQAAGVRMG
jgi:hypothetical protein